MGLSLLKTFQSGDADLDRVQRNVSAALDPLIKLLIRLAPNGELDIPEGSGSSLSLGAATNGLSLAADVLQMALATSSAAGAMSTADKIKADAQQFVSVTDPAFNAGVGGDDVAKIQAAIDYADANDIPTVVFPRPSAGEYTIDCQNLSDSSGLIIVPNGLTLLGYGTDVSRFHVINTTTGNGQDGVNVFRYDAGSSNITFRGLHFQGDNSPFTAADQNQNSCINGPGVGSSDVSVISCVFESLYGFAVHSENHTRTHVIDCLAVDVANSLANVNGDHIKIHGNVCTGGEFAECSGTNVSIKGNVAYAIKGVGITIGGNQTPGSSYPGNIVSLNIIDTVTDGAGITVTDGADSTTVSNNVIRKADLGGIIVDAPLNPPNGLQITGNILESNCVYPGSNVIGIDIRAGNNHQVFGNTAVDLGVAGYKQKYGLSVSNSADIMVVGNRLGAAASGGLKDASFGNGATNVSEDGNIYVNGWVEYTGTATRKTKSIFSKSLTDLLTRYQLPSESPGLTRSRFAESLDGTHYWGDGSNVHDVTLYRSAADNLKTDDTFESAVNLKGPKATLNGVPITYGTAAPTTSAHILGELVINSAPSATGTWGWVCTTAGTPGTWTAVIMGATAGVTAVATSGTTPGAAASSIAGTTLTLQTGDGTYAGLLSPANFTKLAGVAAGATAEVNADLTHAGRVTLADQELGTGVKGVDGLKLRVNTPSAPSAGVVLYTKENPIAMPWFKRADGTGGMLQPFIGGVQYTGPFVSATGGLGLSLTISATTQNTNPTPASTNVRTASKRSLWGSAATSGSSVGYYETSGNSWFGNGANKGGFLSAYRFSFATITATKRLFVGFRAPTAFTNVDPSTFLSCFGVGMDATDSALTFMHNDGSGVATKVPTALTLSTTEVYELRAYSAPNSSIVLMSLESIDSGLSVASYTASTDVPSNTTFFGPIWWANNATTASNIQPEHGFFFNYSEH